MHSQHHVDGSGELRVQAHAVETAQRSERFHARRDLVERVGMQGAGAAIVPRVEGREQVNNLGAANLTDHDAVGSHAQRLPKQQRHGNFTAPFRVGAPGYKAHHMRMLRRKFRRVLNDEHAFGRRSLCEQRGKQRGLTRTCAADDEKRHTGGDEPAEVHRNVAGHSAALDERVEAHLSLA